ncbi:hypothetical protein THIOKS11860007 [Thiocapsa sp. KS1]|nr:hypothetical protein THIOKS11860007 [Thiocapsa sp. KS1]
MTRRELAARHGASEPSTEPDLQEAAGADGGGGVFVGGISRALWLAEGVDAGGCGTLQPRLCWQTS